MESNGFSALILSISSELENMATGRRRSKTSESSIERVIQDFCFSITIQ